MLLAVVVPLLGAVYLAFLLKVVDGDLVEGTLQKYVFLYWWLFSGMEVDTMFVTMNLGADEAAVRSSLLMSLFSLLNMTGFCCFCLFFRCGNRYYPLDRPCALLTEFFRDCGFWSLPYVLSLVQKKSGHKHNYDDKIVVFNKDKLWGPMASLKVIWEKGCEADSDLSHCSFDIHQCGTGAQINAETKWSPLSFPKDPNLQTYLKVLSIK